MGCVRTLLLALALFLFADSAFAQVSPTPTPTAPCPLVTARLTQVSSHLVIACTVKDSTGLPVPSKIVSVQKAPAVTGPFAVWMSKKTTVNGRALLPYVPPTYTWYVRCAAACSVSPSATTRYSVSQILTIKKQKPRPSPTATPRPTSTQVNLSSSFNRTGIVVDGTTFGGGLDANGNALSANLLGASVTFGSARFNLGPVGANDVVSAAGQTIALPSGSYGALTLLATGVNGNQAGQPFTVTYTDTVQATFTQSISDWYTPQNYSGESTAVTMSYRDISDGTKDSRTFYVYVYTFSLNATKTVNSITLPNDANVEVLAIDLLPTGTPMPTVTPTATQRPTPTATPNPTASPQPTGGLPAPIAGTHYKLVWSDEFDGSTLNRKWVKNPWNKPFSSHWANFSYDPSNVSVANGLATITAHNTGGGPKGTWTSEGIETAAFSGSGYTFRYGFVEVRAKLPRRGPGLWPGIWMYVPNGGVSDEIDILEWLGKDVATVYQTYHWNGGQKGFSPKSSDWTADYHLFQMKWTSSSITFYMDNVQTGIVTSNITSNVMYLMLCLDVGDGGSPWGGYPDSSTPTTATFNVDYVRIYQQP